jgi:hypothetical protein
MTLGYVILCLFGLKNKYLSFVIFVKANEGDKDAKMLAALTYLFLVILSENEQQYQCW